VDRYVMEDGFEVEAAQLREDNVAEVSAWAPSVIVTERNSVTGQLYPALNVQTAIGNTRASLNWYIIKHEGKFFVVHPCTFVDNYKLKYEDLPDQPTDEEIDDRPSAAEALGFRKTEHRQI
jgi:hypothetical protein